MKKKTIIISFILLSLIIPAVDAATDSVQPENRPLMGNDPEISVGFFTVL